MAASTNATFRNIASATFQQVGPARIAVLMIHALRQEDLVSDHRRGVADQAVARIRQAEAALSARFPEALADAGMVEPDEMRRSRAAALEVLAPILAALDSGAPPTADILGDPEAFRELCIDRIDPTVTNFLVLMTKILDEAQKRREDEARAETLRAVHAAKSVGRSIQMIAVNATIEAASADAGGRGFKIIADEVRALADRTQTILNDVATRMGG